jgi:hypothetical protein
VANECVYLECVDGQVVDFDRTPAMVYVGAGALRQVDAAMEVQRIEAGGITGLCSVLFDY